MKVVAVFALVALFAIAVTARKCYKCDDTTATKCDDLKTENTGECGNDGDKCYKHGKTDKRKHGCTKDTEEVFCKDLDECSVCDNEDNCNSSSSVMASAALIAVSAILLKMHN